MRTTSPTSANLSQVIYQHLWYEISTLHLKPGEKLSEVKLAKQFDCSRIPVREAIHLLVADGAMETKSQRGSFVTPIDPEQLERIRYLREALEIKIMMDGYRKGCFDPIIPYLESLVARQEELMNAAAYEIAFQMDIEFHKIFYNLTKKEFVLDHTGEKDIHYLRARLLSLQLEEPVIMPQQHRAILDAIKTHNDDALEKAVYQHLNNVNTLVQKKYAALEGYFKD